MSGTVIEPSRFLAMLTTEESDRDRLPWHKRLSHEKIDQLYQYTISQSEPTSEYAIVDLLAANRQLASSQQLSVQPLNVVFSVLYSLSYALVLVMGTVMSA